MSEYAVQNLSPCCGLLATLVLLNSVARWCNTAILYINGVILHACVHERWKEFLQEGTSGFFRKFLQGAKSGEICFLPLKTNKTAFLLKFSNSCPLF